MLRRKRFYKKRKCRVDKQRVFCYNLPCVCGRSSSGRARPCQGRGSEFEPRRPLQKETPSVRMVFSFWNAAGRLELAASTGAERVKSRGPAGLLRMALPFVGCRQRVEPRDEDIAARTLEYMTAMETAPQPEASGLEGDYRILADFNGTILAGTHSKHGVQFITWDRDYDRTDVALRWQDTGAAEKWDRKKQSFRRNPFLASFDYFIFGQWCVIL